MSTDKIYQKYLERLRQKLIAKYNELGLRATGKYEKELEPQVKQNTLIMWGAKHAYYMEHGRGPGKFPPRKAIEDWIDKKQGLPLEFKEKKRQFAYIISRKIANEGITVPNEYNKGEVVSEVVNDFLADDIYQMIEELGILWAKRIQSDVTTILKAA